MTMKCLFGRGLCVHGLAIAAMVLSFTPARGDEREEIQAKIKALKQESMELQANGKAELAEAKVRQAKELQEAFRREVAARENKERQRAADAGKGERKVDHPMALERVERMAQRLRHVREAAEHLKAAEMHDIAHDMMQRAEAMERELVHAKETLARRMEEQPKAKEGDRERSDMEQHLRGMQEEWTNQFRRSREENEQLRREVHELSAQLARIAEELKKRRD